MLRFICFYLGIEFLISSGENLGGLATGGLTAFAWTGSLKFNAILFFGGLSFPRSSGRMSFTTPFTGKYSDSSDLNFAP